MTDGPRFGALRAAAIYFLCTASLFHPILRGALLINPYSDQLHGYSWRVFGGEILASTGDFAHWNPYLLGGIPFIAGQHGDIFYPTFIIRAIAGVDQGLNWSFAVHLFLCGMFTYGFLRAWGLAYLPSVIGGVGYMMSGQIASLVLPGHDGKMYVSALAPLVMWMVVCGMRDGRTWAWGVLALAGALCIVSPHFQMTYYLAMLSLAFVIWLAFQRGEGRLDPAVRWRRLGIAAGTAFLALALGAVHFLPLLEYIPFSPRAGEGRGWEWSTGFSMPPEELINAYLPHFSGIIDQYWGRNGLKLHSEYLGASLLVLAGTAFGAKSRRGFVVFWTAAGIVTALFAFGGHTPFYRLVYHGLPMMKQVRAPGMIWFLTSLAAATLAAVGAERLLDRWTSRRYFIGWAVAAMGVVLLAAAGAFTAIGQAISRPEMAPLIDSNGPALSWGAVRSMVFVAITLGVLAALAGRRVRPGRAGWAMCAIVALDLWTVDRLYYRFMPPAHEVYASDPTVDYLRRIPEPGRVIVLTSRDLNVPRDHPAVQRYVPGDPILQGDGLMQHRVRSLTGNQANEPQSWVDLAGAKSPQFPREVFTREFRRLSNARFILSDLELPDTIPAMDSLRLTRRVGPVRTARGNTAYLYEIMEDNPAAWVAPIGVTAPREAIRVAVRDARFDPRRAALLDSTSLMPPRSAAGAAPPALEIDVVTRYDDDARSIDLQLSAPVPEGAVLVVSENHYPGWSAMVDGRNAPVLRADYSFIGVPLPSGARQVALRFTDRAYERAKPVTLAAIGVTLIIIAYGVVRERRRGELPPPRDGAGGTGKRDAGALGSAVRSRKTPASGRPRPSAGGDRACVALRYDPAGLTVIPALCSARSTAGIRCVVSAFRRAP